ncbi:Succinyl-diaminopimelate desuccinylase [bacterium HR39]|nr:Succinyl-diaminopimelate desuccinylase [bacterium HR39]
MDGRDPVELAAELIRRPSITPADAGCFDLLAELLEPAGFHVERHRFHTPHPVPVDNLYARIGSGDPVLAFSGHVDVVPPGDESAWRHPPFAGVIEDGLLWGRGACDMKGAVAAFTAAALRFADAGGPRSGTLLLLLTADEEGPAENGTRALVEHLRLRGERIDMALVGEPTCEERLGDVLKIGRRGSLTGRLAVRGRMGHVAYPERADNAAHRIVRMLQRLIDEPLDSGSEHFAPSTLQITTVDVGNPTTNVVPDRATAVFNVRFNDRHTPDSLEELLRSRIAPVGGDWTLEVSVSARPFLTPPGPFVDLVRAAVRARTGIEPRLSTSGGTSDARFLAPLCPVVEFGLVGETIHQVDERVAVADIRALCEVYADILNRVFGGA